MKDKVRVVLTASGHAPVSYPAVVADSGQPALAREFVAFLSAPEAQAILGRYGFGKQDGDAAAIPAPPARAWRPRWARRVLSGPSLCL